MKIKSLLSFLLCISLLTTSTYAATYKSGQIVSTFEMVEGFDRTQAQNDIQKTINKQEIKSELLKFGLTEMEVSNRLAALSNNELQSLQDNIKQAQAGGILELVLIVLLIIYLAQRI